MRVSSRCAVTASSFSRSFCNEWLYRLPFPDRYSCTDCSFSSGEYTWILLFARKTVPPSNSYCTPHRRPSCSPIYTVLIEKSFPGVFTHASKFAVVLFTARNHAVRIRSGYDFLFTRKTFLKNVIIFKSMPSIKYYFFMPPALKRKRSTTIISDWAS